MNTKPLHHPSDFPVQTRFEDDGWRETTYEVRYYTEDQVGMMLLNLFDVVSAQNNSPCDKEIHKMTEDWLAAAEKMVKGENYGREKIT